jgi:hypothetical protein
MNWNKIAKKIAIAEINFLKFSFNDERIKSKNLPNEVKRILKNNRFSKREIKLEISNSIQAYANQHAPQYDNFDYSYQVIVNIKNGQITDIQKGLEGNQTKEHTLNDNEVAISGDRVSGYATLKCNFDTFEQNFL